MRTNYFSKVENKYVFNVSLIFWHLLIAIATLGIVVSVLIFLWGIIPPALKKVVKQPYPEKKEYPAPIKVTLADLHLDQIENIKLPQIVDSMVVKKPDEQKPIEDLTGKVEFESTMDTLKTLIPPSKYSWEGKGYYVYPQGELIWQVYEREIYRRWVVTEDGIPEKLNSSFRRANAIKYTQKKSMIDGYMKILKLLPENLRLDALQNMMKIVANNVQRNNDILNAISGVIVKMDKTERNNINIINILARFGIDNPNDGVPFINYVATIIDKFDKSQQYNCVSQLKNGYYGGYFSQNLESQKEATNLYIPLLSQMKPEQQANTLLTYYSIYLDKNNKRNEQIAQINSDYNQAIKLIENQFTSDQISAQQDYESKKAEKEKFRLRALTGLGGGIVLIVLIATFLAFLAIQRSVRKIEEKMLNSKN